MASGRQREGHGNSHSTPMLTVGVRVTAGEREGAGDDSWRARVAIQGGAGDTVLWALHWDVEIVS